MIEIDRYVICHKQISLNVSSINRSTKSSIFGGDPSEDALHLLHRPVSAKSWAELDDVPIKQIRKDVVTLDLNRPYDRCG